MSYIQTLPKKQNITAKAIKTTRIGIFVDTSGSTSGNIKSYSILDHEMKFAHIYKDMNSCVCTWNSTANIYKDKSYVNPSLYNSTGGTYPQCIITNQQTKRMFDTSETIVFMTDGEIDSTDVTKFASLINDSIKNKTIVCVIVCHNNTNPNISVFAPFLTTKDVIMLHYDGGESAKVLFTKGQFNNKYELNSMISLDKIRDMEMVNDMPEIPHGYSIIGETQTHVKIYNPEILMSQQNLEPNDLTTDDWNIILQHAKINNQLTNIRSKVDSWRNISVMNAIETLKKIAVHPLTTKKQELISQIMNCEDETLKVQLSQQLKQIIPEAREEEVKNAQLLNTSLVTARKYWDTIRDMLFHFEEASYNLSDITYTSNRAKRAKNIDESEITNINANHSGVPETYCSLHLDNGPTVLWLQSPSDIEHTTNDFVLNYPLAKHTQLQKCIKANPVCGDCAAGYFAIKKETIYHEPIDGYIPINVHDNKQMVYIQLSKILCGSKCLGHVNMLLLSMIDDCKYDWMDQCVKDYLIKELIDNTITTETFGEEGHKTVLRDALKKLNNEVLSSQPIYSAIRMLILSKIYNDMPNITVVEFIKERFKYALISSVMSSLLKNGVSNNVNVIDSLLYDKVCGIPIVKDTTSIHLPALNELETLCGKQEVESVYEIIMRMSKLLNMDINILVPPEMIAQVLCACKSVRVHERPLTVYNKLATSNQLFKQSSVTEKEKVIVNLINDLVGKYKKCDENSFIVPYAFYNGIESSPSKIFFKDELLISAYLGQYCETSQLATITYDRVYDRIANCYGSRHPNETSAHTNAHQLVARICETNYKNLEEPTMEVFAKCFETLRNTCGKKGNIYNPIILKTIIYCVYDFFEIKKKHNYYVDDTSMRIEHKVYCELAEQGAKFNGSYVTVPHTLTKPIDLNIKYQHVDVNALLNKITEYMNTKIVQNVIDTNSEIINFTITTPFVIDVPEKQQKLEMWDKEQKEIASQVSLVDTFKLANVKKIGGMDISFDKNNASNAVASMVIFEYPFDVNKQDKDDSSAYKILAKFNIKCTTNIPYRAGYLAFRECPILLKLIDIIRKDFSQFMPDVIITDSNGVWHQRACGLATHFSVLSGIPTLGVAKTILQVNDITENGVLDILREKGPNAGDAVKIVDNTGKELGYAYNPTGAVHNCLCVSAGNMMSNDTAMEIVKSISIHRVVEPVRQADLLSRSLL
jgi:deoxyinosine 3'endonuclease (endonuclease V)